jgi:DNA-binding MarR family transcriptional regulator
MPLPIELNPIHTAITGMVRDEFAPDLTMRQLTVLMTAANRDTKIPMSVREVNEITLISKPAITRAVSLLESLELVGRRLSTTDKRLVNIIVTPKGYHYLRKMVSYVNQPLPELKKKAA